MLPHARGTGKYPSGKGHWKSPGTKFPVVVDKGDTVETKEDESIVGKVFDTQVDKVVEDVVVAAAKWRNQKRNFKIYNDLEIGLNYKGDYYTSSIRFGTIATVHILQAVAAIELQVKFGFV